MWRHFLDSPQLEKLRAFLLVSFIFGSRKGRSKERSRVQKRERGNTDDQSMTESSETCRDILK